VGGGVWQVTSLDESLPLTEFDWTVPTAVVFGNELSGASATALAMADGIIRIPMVRYAVLPS
jgi:tRNA (guanosine-2'-O-)-methyltransferase